MRTVLLRNDDDDDPDADQSDVYSMLASMIMLPIVIILPMTLSMKPKFDGQGPIAKGDEAVVK